MLAADERAGTFLEIPLPEVLASDLPRVSVARWKLLECVGEGGLGVVYRAECVEDGVKLEAAVKILRPGLDTGKFREKFVKERQILAGLDHPGIVRLMDCGADSHGRSFMVMEFIRGEPLNTYLERANPSVPRRLELFESVCEAVSYLHSRLIIHGDIKPANVLVTPAGISKLLDFGASSLLAANTVRARRTDAGDADAAICQSGAEARRGAIGSRGHLFAGAALGRDFASARPNARTCVTFSSARWQSSPAERYLSVSDLLGRPAPLAGRPSAAHPSGHGRVPGAALPAQKLGRRAAHGAARNLAGRRMVARRAGFAPCVRSRGRGLAPTPVRARSRAAGTGE